MSWFEEYELVTSLEEAAELLAEPGSALIGGGSRLVAHKPAATRRLVDLMPLGLDCIRDDEQALRLEARVRLEDLVQREDFDGLLKQAIHSLAHSSNLRNQMTVGGETAWPHHLNEWQVALLALDAVIERHDADPLPASDYMAGTDRAGIITTVAIPKRPGWRHGFERVAAADGARPLLVLATAIHLAEDRLSELRLAAGNLSPLPQRLGALETRLAGSALSALDAFTLADGDLTGVSIEDSPGADRASKRDWLQTCLRRSFDALRAGAH